MKKCIILKKLANIVMLYTRSNSRIEKLVVSLTFDAFLTPCCRGHRWHLPTTPIYHSHMQATRSRFRRKPSTCMSLQSIPTISSSCHHQQFFSVISSLIMSLHISIKFTLSTFSSIQSKWISMYQLA